MRISFTDRVAIVTGAGGGLGRQHALALARRGARVVVNDVQRPSAEGHGGLSNPADAAVAEIIAAGGQAIANAGSVADPAAVAATVQQAVDTWGRIDILVNNAGILRAKSFAKMGTFERAHITLTSSLHLGTGDDVAEAVAAQFGAISDRSAETVPERGSAQGSNEVSKAMAGG